MERSIWYGPVRGVGTEALVMPIFNFADACISVSVVAILLFCRRELTPVEKVGESENDGITEPRNNDITE